MNGTRIQPVQNARIVWAIAAKDLVDGFRNRTILSGIVTILFLMSLYHWLPGLYKSDHINVAAFDTGGSQLADEMEADPGFRLWRVDSEEELRAFMSDGDAGEIGIVIPADADQRMNGGETVELQGHVLWGSRHNADRLAADLEQSLSELSGHPVKLRLGDPVYLRTSAMGMVRFIAVSIVVTTFFTGVLIIPNLMFEEKERKTLETLLISPASIRQVVFGKALAGSILCLLLTVLAVALSWRYVVNWALIAMAIVSGILFSVALGLLMGTFLENKQQANSWILIVGNILVVPVFLSSMDPILPPAVREILPWMPMVSQALLFRYGFAGSAAAGLIWPALVTVLAAAFILLAIVGWKVDQLRR